MARERVLWVDDDIDALLLIRRALGERYDLTTCQDGQDALHVLRTSDEFAVVASDMRMPGMSGAQLLAATREISPRSVRVMLTGLDDQLTASRAVNEGRVFGFLNKSASIDELKQCLEAAVAEYHAQAASLEILENTLVGAVRALMDALAVAQPLTFSRGASIRRISGELCRTLGVRSWEAELAALVSQVGCITLPSELPGRVLRREVTPAEQQAYLAHPGVGAELLRRIPRLERVAEIVLYQHQQYDGGGYPYPGRAGDAIPLGSRILKLAIDFTDLTMSGASTDMALARLRTRTGWYDPDVLRALGGRYSAAVTRTASQAA
ncbi:MAG: HD domain-containing phosphohydrolase [Hyphomicrobiales bacterium]